MSGLSHAAVVGVCGSRPSVAAGLEPDSERSQPASLEHIPLPALES